MVVIECLGPLVYKLQTASVESHFTKRTLIVSCVCILNDLEILNCIFFFFLNGLFKQYTQQNYIGI